MGLDEEDGLSIERPERLEHDKPLRIVVLRLKYISNFTDFAPFAYEPDVELIYSLWDEDITSADLIIVPGSKNTVADLMMLRESGIEACIKKAVGRGASLIGVCGGYQMLGNRILDPYAVESSLTEVDGMGLLDTETTLDRTKTTCQVSASIVSQKWFDAVESTSGCRWNHLKGYEIHMGNTTGDVGLFKICRGTSQRALTDGSAKGNVWGTYIHGIFDNDGLRTAIINSLRLRKGFELREASFSYQARREEAINSWAETLGNSVDICFILREIGMESCLKKISEDLA
jgi:adenosylcobyric acid synthase